jgi:hypothetical protein
VEYYSPGDWWVDGIGILSVEVEGGIGIVLLLLVGLSLLLLCRLRCCRCPVSLGWWDLGVEWGIGPSVLNCILCG